MTTSDRFDTLELRRTASFVTIMLDRSEALNAINARLLEEVSHVLDRVADDEGVRGLIISGAGDRAFAAGADVNEFAAGTLWDVRRQVAVGQALFERVERLGKPVIAAVNGLALGGGCELAMACTYRLASTAAKFGQPEVRLGLVPGFGGTQRLRALVGRSQATRLILTGETIDAVEALRLGLVDEIVAPDHLLDRAEQLLAAMTAHAPLATRLALEAINGPAGSDRAFAAEALSFALCSTTGDMREGVAAFRDKRPPTFAGQ